MPRRGWKAPEPRDCPVRVYYTEAERNRVELLARAAAVQLAVFIREVSLGSFTPGKRRDITIDGVRFTQILGALHATGDQLKQLVDLLKDNEDVRYDHWYAVECKLSNAIESLMKTLEAL